MVDIVIPLGIGSRWQDNELRICLRAIEANLTNYRNIWIVGNHPKWLTNVNHIPMADHYRVPDYNIMLKIKTACENPQISDRFLFMNDDHYLMHKFDAETFPNYYEGTCHDLIKKRNCSPYQKRVQNTCHYLISKKLPQYYFDIHYPIIYEKSKFVERVVSLPWHKNHTGFVIKSLYANHEEEKTATVDGKSAFIPWKTWPVYSTTPVVPERIKDFLFKYFPNPSKYEKHP